MSEFEKMQEAISLAATEQEKEQLIDAINVLRNSFLAMISGVGTAITSDGQMAWNTGQAEQAMQIIRRISSQYCITFPEINNAREMKHYLIRWGMDIVRLHRD